LADLRREVAKGNCPAGWDYTQKVIVAYGIAVGMVILHSNRVLHRDLKPGNVFLTARLEPVVADFGVSKFIDPERVMETTGTLGTPGYIAPEYVRDNVCDSRFDVFGYGVTLYVMFTGLDPYPPGRNPYGIPGWTRDGNRPTIPEHTLSDPLRALICAAWHQSPEKRPDFPGIVEAVDRLGADDGVDRERFTAYKNSILTPFVQSVLMMDPKTAYQQAPLSDLELWAAMGDGTADYELGTRYREGTGVDKDLGESAAHMRRSAEAGCTAGMIEFATMLEGGIGVEVDLAATELWRGRAIMQPDVERSYFRVSQSNHDTARVCKQAADAVDPPDVEAQFFYAGILETGRFGVRKDLAGAAQYYEMAARGGNVPAMVRLGVLVGEGALGWLWQAAELGDAEGQWRFGLAAERGQGIDVDFTMAANYYRLSADAGNSPGEWHLGLAFLNGMGVGQDLGESTRLFRLSADHQNSDGQWCYGRALARGDGVARDLDAATHYYQLSADQGNPVGQYCFAVALHDGVGVAADQVQSVDYFKRAADQGHRFARFRYAVGLLSGRGVARDLVEAAKYIKIEKPAGVRHFVHPLQQPLRGPAAVQNLIESAGYFKHLADRGDASARFCYALAVLETDAAEAVRYFKSAAVLGHVEAQFWYGALLCDGIGRQSVPVEGFEYLRSSAEHGDPNGQWSYARLLEVGESVPQNLVLAAQMYKASADQGNAFGQVYYGLALADGEGVARDPAAAVEYFELSANKGHGLGQAYYGMSLTRDPVLAADYFRLSAMQGCPIGLREYGKALRAGRGVAKDVVEAAKYLSMAVARDEPEARELLEAAPDFDLRLILLGDWGVGKTTILAHFGPVDPTRNCASKLVPIQEAGTMARLFDPSGQEQFRAVPPSYYRNADGALIVFDLTSRQSFDSVPYWLDQLELHGPPEIPIWLLGNKSDLEPREVSAAEISALAHRRGLSATESCASHAVDLEQPFTYLLDHGVTHQRGSGAFPAANGTRAKRTTC
jgi:small GTP-binding protein